MKGSSSSEFSCAIYLPGPLTAGCSLDTPEKKAQHTMPRSGRQGFNGTVKTLFSSPALKEVRESFKKPISQPSRYFCMFVCLFVFVFLLFLWAAPTAYGGSQARGLRQSHSNAGSKSRLRPTPQLTATPDP